MGIIELSHYSLVEGKQNSNGQRASHWREYQTQLPRKNLNVVTNYLSKGDSYHDNKKPQPQSNKVKLRQLKDT